MMLGYLLARSGVDVVVLERHADFFRDFRGDTIHPSTLELMRELGILEDFLRLPHQEQQRFEFRIGRERVLAADFSRLPTHCKFMVFMPQWDFLNFIAGKAKRFPGFHLLMQADVTDLVRDGVRVVGALAATPGGEITVRAALVVGTDGRHSTVREKAGLESVALGSPIDVLWMRISRRPDDPEQTLGTFDAGKGLVMLNRSEYWQCGYIIPKGTLDGLKQRGIAAFRGDLLALVPWLHGRVNELEGWDDIKLLTVMVDRLVEWYRPGVLCIGDAAHAMSPIGGVGVNLAIQDAVAAANNPGAGSTRTPGERRTLEIGAAQAGASDAIDAIPAGACPKSFDQSDADRRRDEDHVHGGMDAAATRAPSSPDCAGDRRRLPPRARGDAGNSRRERAVRRTPIAFRPALSL